MGRGNAASDFGDACDCFEGLIESAAFAFKNEVWAFYVAGLDPFLVVPPSQQRRWCLSGSMARRSSRTRLRQ